MAILFTCQCGRTLSIDDSKAGKKGRCTACGAVLRIPDSPTLPAIVATSPVSTDHGRGDGPGSDSLSEPPAIRTPVFLLYLGLVAVAAMFWAAFATWRLQLRARELNDVRLEVASAREQGQAVLKQRADADGRAQAQLRAAEEQLGQAGERLKAQMVELADLKAREQKGFQADERFPRLRDGNNIVKQGYVDSLAIDEQEVRFIISNKTDKGLRPTFDLLLFDKRGHITATVDVNWGDDPIEPGKIRTCYRSRPTFKSGSPVAYSIRFLSPTEEPQIDERKGDPKPARSVPTKEATPRGGENPTLARIEEAFKPQGISVSTRQAIFRDLCLAELKAQREADRLYPLPEQWQANMRHHDQMTSKYEEQVRQRYGLTKAQVDMIALEAGIRRWPVPSGSASATDP